MQTRLDESVWFITGCSTGFGREIARLALERGWRAVVTARDPARVADIVAGHGDRALALALDVTDPAQVAAAVARAEAHFGRIDVLVNNAGHGFLAAIEEAAESEVRELFEVNFFGLVAMTRSVLPGMRARRSGAVVNITSVGGLVGRAASGYYAASKFAVEGLSEALCQELAPLGIRVMLVEPGGFRTEFLNAVPRRTHPIDDYQVSVGARIDALMSRNGRQPGDPAKAAQAIVTALESDHTPLHLVLGEIAADTVRDALQGKLAEIERWREVSVGADYPADRAG